MGRKSRKRHRRRSARPRVRRQTAPGAVPGTVKVHPDAPQPVVRVMAYSPTQILEEEISDLRRLPELLAQHAVVWVNVDGLGDAETIKQLGDQFGLHMLALEDVVNVHQLAKVEEYGEHLFIVARMANVDQGHLVTEQISIFLGRNFVLTFQERPGDCLDPVRQRLRKGRGRIRKAGADYLAYSILDAVIDDFFPTVDSYGDRLEKLDEETAQLQGGNNMEELHAIRVDLMMLRRAVRPLRDALVKLMPDPTALIAPETQIYMRDCYDHTVQLIDLLDTYREMCSNLRDFHLSTISQRMNEIMKVLTIIATIFIPLGFIAGVYGMNFDPNVSPWNMPELRWVIGYPFALTLMAGVAVAMLVYFRRKGWMGGGS